MSEVLVDLQFVSISMTTTSSYLLWRLSWSFSHQKLNFFSPPPNIFRRSYAKEVNWVLCKTQIIPSVQYQTTTIALVSIQQTSITAWLQLCLFTARPLMEWELGCKIRSLQRKSILFKARQMEMTAGQQSPNTKILLTPLSAISQVGPLLFIWIFFVWFFNSCCLLWLFYH